MNTEQVDALHTPAYSWLEMAGRERLAASWRTTAPTPTPAAWQRTCRQQQGNMSEQHYVDAGRARMGGGGHTWGLDIASLPSACSALLPCVLRSSLWLTNP